MKIQLKSMNNGNMLNLILHGSYPKIEKIKFGFNCEFLYFEIIIKIF